MGTLKGAASGFGVALAAVLCAGCPQYGVIDDGTSVSYGKTNAGMLLEAVELPRRGEGYWIPERWAERGLVFGTDEMISTIVFAGRRVADAHPDSRFGVGDISPRRGGPSAWHSSHQTGRDADLLFLAEDADGDPIELDRMLHFRSDGTAREDPSIHFDVERNWTMIRALLENPVAELQYLFISEPLKQKLLDHARAEGEPAALVAYASYILHQPTDSLPHNDHLHVRIYCARSDRDVGCRDRGVLRWTKKDYKYRRDRSDPAAAPTSVRALLSEAPGLLVVTGGRVFR